ncbi:MAG: hypothetical protein IKY86_05035 [Clostridia bacterium]|nr:hypothetical protein [Clostridia bacterium]
MFGTLTVRNPEKNTPIVRGNLRLRPAKGLRQGRGLYRMTMFAWAEVTLPDGWKDSLREKRVGAALSLLRANGVREAVLPPQWHQLARGWEIHPVSCRRALEACAGEAVLEACRALELPPGEVCLSVCGRAIPAPVHGELLSLARSVRTVRVWGEDNDGLRTKLWRGCGIVDRGAMPRGLPVIGLLLEGGQMPRDALLTVDLTDGGEEEPGERIWRPSLIPPAGALAQKPEGVPDDAFAAALFSAGAIRPREIRVSRLDIAKHTQYNKEIVEKCL